MDKRKLKIALSLAVLIPCVLYAAGIIAQFIININAWKAAGSDYRISPGLPSSQISEVVRALFHFPEGLIAIGVVVLGIAVLCVFGLRIGWGQNGVTDSDRNLTVSNSGSYGTASFMSPKEASACFEVTSAKKDQPRHPWDAPGWSSPDASKGYPSQRKSCRMRIFRYGKIQSHLTKPRFASGQAW